MSRLHQAIEMAAQARKQSKPAVPTEEVPVMAPIPLLASGRDRLLEVSPLKPDHSCIAGLHGRNEEAGEEYRKLRSMLVRMTRGDEFHNTLIVTSTLPGEGKTLTAINLAIALAQEYDHTVLLVDADLRNPSVHRYLGIKAEVGLAHCLRGHASLSSSMVKTGLGKLVVLPAGGKIDNPAEHLASARMKEIIRELKTRYPDRYIIFDTAPVLPVADAQVLAQEVDGVLFVVREGGPSLEDVATAFKSLDGARMLGIVYNDAETLGRHDYYYKYK